MALIKVKVLINYEKMANEIWGN